MISFGGTPVAEGELLRNFPAVGFGWGRSHSLLLPLSLWRYTTLGPLLGFCVGEDVARDLWNSLEHPQRHQVNEQAESHVAID